LTIIGRAIEPDLFDAVEILVDRLADWSYCRDRVWSSILEHAFTKEPEGLLWLDACGRVRDRNLLAERLPDILARDRCGRPEKLLDLIADWREFLPDLYWPCAFVLMTRQLDEGSPIPPEELAAIPVAEIHWTASLLHRAKHILFGPFGPFDLEELALPEPLAVVAAVLAVEVEPSDSRIDRALALLAEVTLPEPYALWKARLLRAWPPDRSDAREHVRDLCTEVWSTGYPFDADGARIYLEVPARFLPWRLEREIRAIHRFGRLDESGWLTLIEASTQPHVVEAVLEVAEEIAWSSSESPAEGLACRTRLTRDCVVRHVALVGDTDILDRIGPRLLPGERAAIEGDLIPVLDQRGSHALVRDLTARLPAGERQLIWRLRSASHAGEVLEPTELYEIFRVGERLRDEHTALTLEQDNEPAGLDLPSRVIRDAARHKQAIVDTERVRRLGQKRREPRNRRMDVEYVASGDDRWFLELCPELCALAGIRDEEVARREILKALEKIRSARENPIGSSSPRML